jgi:flagellar biosynthesis/type III secretory pathway M-ring protein FliF/YscJ
VTSTATLKALLHPAAVVREVRFQADGELLGTSKLVNSSAIELSRNAFLTNRLTEILSKGWVIAILSVLLLFAILYIILVSRYRRLRKMHLKERKRAEARRREQEKAKPTRIEYDLSNAADHFDFSAEMSEIFDEEKK